ncbi:MAG: hypothetical protein LBH98_04845 [Chitinispirillales bacterium]|jgi:hypothetical protein|nr:hypothetical protein [Chitinispirillales bacterium]
MNDNAVTRFFMKIHLSVFDSGFLASEILVSNLKNVAAFFSICFFLSLVLASVSRVIKISEEAPRLAYSALGTVKFENYVLVYPDTLKQIDSWKLTELGTLVSGVKLPKNVSYPIEVTIGTDSVKNNGKPFLHAGKNEFSTNIMSILFERKPQKIQRIGWKKILKNPNVTADENFYKAYFKKVSNKFGFLCTEFVVIGLEMLKSLFHIWLPVLIYLLFFGKRLKFNGKIKLVMFAAIPYLIITPVSLLAAKGILFTTDISLVCAVIITIRALVQIEKNCTRKDDNETI